MKFGKTVSVLLCAAMALSLCACAKTETAETAATAAATAAETAAADGDSYQIDLGALAVNMSAWNYDAENDVYWQIGVAYCTEPAADDYESMGIYVPGAYFDGTENADGTYTCVKNSTGTVGGYTADTAPIVIPVNTAGYAAQAAPTSYSADGLTQYLSAGFVYVYAGCRGRNNGTNADGTAYDGGAPWGVTDLKAAVRCLRLNAAELPGDTDKIFTFGHSGGGAQSSLMGATGDSALYLPYLESIGSAVYDDSGNYISDAICGAMCWCPITALDEADEAYEWMMGQYADTGTRADDTWTSALSDDLAKSYADFVNAAGFTDGSGNALTLTESSDGIYASGSYYTYLLGVIQQSLNNFLSDTAFPYTSGGSTMADGGFAGGGSAPTGTAPTGSAPTATGDTAGGLPSGSLPSGGTMGGGTGGSTESTTYETAQDYIDALNSDETWISYDSATNTATVTSIQAFVEHCKNASKDVCAFDDLNRGQAENAVFGNGTTDALHFDATIASLLESNSSAYAAFSDWDSSYVTAYEGDMGNTDALGTATAVRQEMYNPMYYVSAAYEGNGTSTVAKYWRIRTGIDQGDTSLTTEVNLALALQQCSGVESVDFATVWGLGHTTAERTGDSKTNFIAWVSQCAG